MMENTPIGTEKHRESAKPEGRQTTKMLVHQPITFLQSLMIL